MTRKQVALVLTLMVAASSVSALVAYRLALHRFSFPYADSSASGESGMARCVDFHDAGSHLGETLCVSGRVLRVFTSRAGNTFVDFCSDYRNCPFTSVIFSSDRNKFGNLQALVGRLVEFQGPINSYQGRAEIIIHDPQQIRVLP
jgi:hypothetical protein